MKKYSIIFVVVLVLCCVAGFFVKNFFFIENDIDNYMTLDELQDKKIVLESYSSQVDFSEEDLKKFVETECEAAGNGEYVFNVTPTGNLYINNSVIMQEVSVNSVIKGKCDYEKIWICSQGCSVNYKNGVYELQGMDSSFMQPEDQYLVVCIPSEINSYSDKKVYYTVNKGWHSVPPFRRIRPNLANSS
jgi:hypothetical protein